MNEQRNKQTLQPRRVAIVAVVIIAVFALCLGVYFGIFISLRVYGGGG